MILEFKQRIKEITDNSQVLSQYRANSILQKGSDVPLDDTPLTLEDIKILKKYLKTACMEIMKVISGYQSSIVTDEGETLLPFEFDVADPEDVEEDPDKNFLIIRLSMPETFNASMIDPMDDAIRDALESYLLYRTAKHKTNEIQSYYQDFENAIGMIRSYINMRIRAVRRNYNILE